MASAKFDEGFDISIRLGVDPRKADQMVRGTVALPAGTGKDVRVAVFATGEAADAARAAGRPVVVRVKMPDHDWTVRDQILGDEKNPCTNTTGYLPGL